MTNLNIAKLYLATTTATAAQIDAAIADGSAATTVNALTGTTLLNAIYQASFGRDADAEGLAYWGASTLTGDALVTAINAGAAVYVANDAYPENVAIAANDTVVVAAKTTADAAATASFGAAAVAIATVTDATTAATAVTTIETAITAAANAGETFTLTTSDDSLIGTTANDTFEGTSATLSADDRILDASITDNDTLNLVLTADPAAMDVSNVENINMDWDAYGTPDVDLDNVTGATVTLSSDKSGYLGSANITNTGSNNIVLGAGITGTAKVCNIEDATLTANFVETLNTGCALQPDGVTAGTNDGTLSITAAAATTVNVGSGDDITLVAASATTVALGGNTALKTANVTLSKDANVTLGNGATTEFTLQSTEDIALEIAAGATFETLTIAGENAIDLEFENAADLTAQEVINGGAITVADALGAVVDYTKVASTSITFAAAQGAQVSAITTNTGANFVIAEADGNAGADLTFLTDDDTSNDTITVTVQGTLLGDLDFADDTVNDDDSFEVANIVIDEEVDADAVDVTLALILADTNTVNISSANNDLTVTSITAAEVNATALAGDLILTQTADAEMMVIGGQADNTINFKGVDTNSTFIANETSDAVDTIGFLTEDGDAVAIVQGGNNEITAAALAEGQLTVIAGAGDDTVTVAGASMVNGSQLSLNLGDGDNVVEFDMSGARTTGTTVELTTGTGDDSVTIGADTEAEDEITLTLGTGSNTLNLADTLDITLGTIELSGIDIINVNNSGTVGANASNAIVNTADFTGKTLTVTSANEDSAEDDTITFTSTATLAETIDLSNVTIDQTITNALAGTAINAAATDSEITGTSVADVIDAAAGADTVYMTDGADTVSLGGADGDVDTVVFTGSVSAEAGGLVITEVAGDNAVLEDTDTVDSTTLDLITEFVINSDKIDLSAYGLEAGTVVQDGADPVGELSVGNGEYGIIYADDAETATADVNNAAGADTIIIWDADTTSGISLVGVVLTDALLDADDLILA